VRHGESRFNRLSVLQGQLDPIDTNGYHLNGLSDVGYTQAESRPMPDDADLVFTSDLARAVETAESMVASVRLGVGITKTALLRERSLGVVEGLKKSDIQDNPMLAAEWAAFVRREHEVVSSTPGTAVGATTDCAMTGGETESDVAKRVLAFVDLVRHSVEADAGRSVYADGSASVYAVTHLGFIRAAYQVAGEVVPRDVRNLSFSRFRIQDNGALVALAAPDEGLGDASAVSL